MDWASKKKKGKPNASLPETLTSLSNAKKEEETEKQK